MKIGIIDYGMGNLRSVSKAIEHLGFEVFISSEPSDIVKADKVILPGVGAFGDAMRELNKNNMPDTIKEIVGKGTPLLGICLGLQVFFDEGEESPGVKGLGLLRGKVVRFKGSLKVPHMGWNALKIKQQEPLFKSLQENPYVYFVHSYYVAPYDTNCIAATSEYGLEFTAAVTKNNIMGTQFHPEKSQSVGLKILENFCSF